VGNDLRQASKKIIAQYSEEGEVDNGEQNLNQRKSWKKRATRHQRDGRQGQKEVSDCGWQAKQKKNKAPLNLPGGQKTIPGSRCLTSSNGVFEKSEGEKKWFP